jgi:predicted N-acyltransferase
MIIEEFTTVRDVPAEEWNALEGNHAMTSTGWLLLMETCQLEQYPVRYVVARDEQGILGAVTARLRDHAKLQNPDRVLFASLTPLFRAVGLSAMPAIVCGADSPVGRAILVRSGLPAEQRSRVAEALIEHINQLGDRTGRTVIFRNVQEGCFVRQHLERRGFLSTRDWPLAFLDRTWDSFQQYRQQLRKQHPSTENNIRQELSRARKHGLRIERLDLERASQWAAQAHALMDMHFQRLGGQAFPYRPQYWPGLHTHLRDYAMVNAAYLADEMIGIALVLKWGDTLHMPNVGINAQRGIPAAAYSNLSFNYAVDVGTQMGVRRFLYGRSKYSFKMRRGCQLEGSLIYLRPSTLLKRTFWPLFFPIRTRKMEHKIASAE